MGDDQADRARNGLTDPMASGTSERPGPRSSDLGDPGPTLSICVPTFNRPDHVRRAIASIIQSAADAGSEVEIIVSDNSPDLSEQACRQALEAWSGRSLYIGNRPDLGMTANFNQCIARASGRYVLFIHDDDRLLPGGVPAIVQALAAREERDPVVLFGVYVVDGAGRVMRRQEFRRDARLDASDALGRVLSDIEFVRFSAVVVRRDAYAAVGPFDADVGNANDLDMWVRLFARFGVRCVPKTISAYSVHTDTATGSMSFDAVAVAKLMDVFERARGTGVLSAATIRRCQARFFHQFILGAAYLRLRQGDVAGAREVMDLFQLPSVRSLGPSLAWLPVRLIFSMLVRCPSNLVRLLMNWVDRLDLVRKARPTRWRRRGWLRER